jgi:hypothetical protein
MEAMVLGPKLNRVPSMIHMLVIIPLLLIGLAASFSRNAIGSIRRSP